MKNGYLGFYTSRPFWAGNPLDIRNPETKTNFTALMSKVEYSFEDEQFKFDVCKDGMLMIQIFSLESEKPSMETPEMEDIINWWARYLNYANCLQLLLDSSILEVKSFNYLELFNITNKDAVRLSFENGKLESESVSIESFIYSFQMLRYPSAIPFESIFWTTSLENRPSFQEDVFSLAAQKFSYAVKNERLVEILAGITKSIAEYKIGNYSISLILSWFAIEVILNQKWLAFIEEKNLTYEDGRKRINSDRFKRLTGHDYSISVALNLMELSDIFSFSLFKDIDDIRDYRNKVVHQEEEYVCLPEHCILAIQTALKLVLEEKEFNIIPNLGRSISGV